MLDSPDANRSCTGIRPALASTFAGLPHSVIDEAAELTSVTSGSEDLPLMPFSLPHRPVLVRGDLFKEHHAGELQLSARDNTCHPQRREGFPEAIPQLVPQFLGNVPVVEVLRLPRGPRAARMSLGRTLGSVWWPVKSRNALPLKVNPSGVLPC